MPSQAEINADTQHIHEALAYAMTGNLPRAGEELSAVYSKSRRHMYIVWCALAEIAVRPSRATLQPGHSFGLIVEDVVTGPANIDDAPPALRMAMRFMAAQANDDGDSTKALFLSALQGEGDIAVEALPILLGAAVATVRDGAGR